MAITATSTLVFYKTAIKPEKNMRVDDLEDYLASIAAADKKTVSGFQYQRIEPDLTIKVNESQDDCPDFDYDYVSITNSNDAKTYYYFILDNNWLSRGTIQLRLSMDTVNTFWSDISTLWMDETVTTRQHKDRFCPAIPIPGQTLVMYRKVDKISEGISPIQYRQSTPTKIGYGVNLNFDWYLIYKTQDQLSDDNLNNPLSCYLCASDPLKIQNSTPTGSVTISSSDLIAGTYYYFLKSENPGITGTINIGGVTRNLTWSGYDLAYAIIRTSSNTYKWYRIRNKYSGGVPTGDVEFYEETISGGLSFQISATVIGSMRTGTSSKVGDTTVIKTYPFSYQWNYGTPEVYVNDISTVDRTDSRIMKIIKLPYPPATVSYNSGTHLYSIGSGWSYDDNTCFWKADSLDNEFSSTLPYQALYEMEVSMSATDLANVLNTVRNKKFESKLYHSDFYSKKFIYDSFSKDIRCENINTAAGSPLRVRFTPKFKPTNNIASKFIFDIQNSYYDHVEDYGSILSIDRNNEMSLFNNDYLNYMRYSYSYDIKEKNRNLGTGIATGVITTAAAIVSAFVPGGKGLTVAAGIMKGAAAAATLISAVSSSISAQESIEQKKNSLAAQAGSIQGSNDVNLLSYYNGNRLATAEYAPSSDIQDQLWNLFRLTGYKCNDYGIPTFDSRIWFNFVQCSPEFAEGFRYGSKFLDDIKARFQIGVTVFHHNDISGVRTYDFWQTKENFESWLA